MTCQRAPPSLSLISYRTSAICAVWCVMRDVLSQGETKNTPSGEFQAFWVILQNWPQVAVICTLYFARPLIKTKTPTKKENFERRKKIMSKISWKSWIWCFFSFLNFHYRVFFGFQIEGKSYFECITEEVFRWNLAVKWCKTHP